MTIAVQAEIARGAARPSERYELEQLRTDVEEGFYNVVEDPAILLISAVTELKKNSLERRLLECRLPVKLALLNT